MTTDADGLVDSLNPVAEKLTGWAAGEAKGRPLAEVMQLVDATTQGSVELAEAVMVRTGAMVPSGNQLVLIARDGASKHIDINPSHIKNDQSETTGVVIIFRDVSEGRRVEEALRESEVRFRQLANHITDVFWIFDPTCAGILYISPAYEKVWGRSCQSLYERPLSYLEAIHPEDRERARQAHRMLEGGRPTSNEYRVLRPDGTLRWVWDRGFPIKDESDHVVRLVGIAEDVTERKQAGEALRESEQRFRTMADATPIMIWGSGTDTLCNYFNKPWLDFTGRTIEQELGEGWSENIHPDDQKRCLEVYLTAFDSREPFTMEYRVRRHDGEYRWVLDTGVPRFAPDGTFSGYIGSCIDITDRKRAEEKLRSADRRKEEFLAVLSHELRNPLAPIQAALDSLEQAASSVDSTRLELVTIKRQVQNLERLVDDLLDVSRISRGTIELRKGIVNIHEVVRHSIEANRPLISEQHQELHVSAADGPILLEADSTRLEQILSNLLNNAAKYTPHGGQIWLNVERSDHTAVIQVRDNGIGIIPELLERVFDPFVQGEHHLGPYHQGVGIGLSLVKNLVELHGGTISAQSIGPGMGSAFRITLPALRVENHDRPSTSELTPSQTPEVLSRRRILIVDDNVSAADSMARLLTTALGQDVRVVYDGSSALELARSFRPHVILLDLEMAGMDGYELASRLRQPSEACEAALVAVTGWAQDEYRRRSRENGIDLHLVKPVPLKELRAVLAELEPRPEELCSPHNTQAMAHR
jgi:PAS domain S-box-containing protein